RLEGRRWAIAAALPDEPEAKSADWEPLELPVVDHVVVTASRYELQGDEVRGSHVIGPAELNDNPSFGGDALRIVHRLPGAASIGVTAKPNVRGGSDNELLVMFDGVELIEPFHLRDFQSMFSSFNPQTIESVEFFSGGFPAKYGNKMSGVLDIATQDAFEAPGGELGISAFSLSALYFNETERDQWLLSARRGNLDLVLQSKLGDPRYHDLYGRYSREIKEGRLKASTFVFDDDIVFTDDESSAKSRVKNRYAWFEWERDKKDRASRTILSFGSIDSRRKGFTFAEEDTEGFLVDDQKLEISSLRHLQEYRINDRFRLDFGGTYRHQSMDYDTQIQVTRDVVSEFLGVETDVDTTFREKFDGNSISLFATAKFQTGDRLTTEIGLRWDRQDYAKSDSQLSPRVALLFNINGQWDLRLSYGRFHQPHAIHELKTTDFETGFFKSQKSEHYILATEYRFSNDTRLVAEAFFKKMEDLKPRYVNLFDPYVYLPELQQDRITIYADKAEAKGIELSYTGGGEKFEWNVNYTYSEVQDRDGGRWIDRRWDQTHNLNVFLNWYLGNWTVGAAMAWHTGWATTELPQTLPAAQSLEIPAYRNNSKLKDYGSLDFKVSYDQELSGSSLQYFLEVTNVVSRANKGGVDYEITAGDDVYFLEEFDVQPVFPLVTNLGVIWRF
ncbi:MAG: TonB-dependent receptor, partial [Gammaproteobacteria bacterium]|nr:TonB-dependent receptor [Gammaproteobacteria bacterium]